MKQPTDIGKNFWDWLRRGLYALKSELAYGVKWEFVLEEDENGDLQMVYEEDENGVPFLATESSD